MPVGPVSVWPATDKIAAAITRSTEYMPAHFRGQLQAFLTPLNIGIMAGTLALWAGSHFFGVGEVVDVGLLLVGAVFVGWSMTDVMRSLVTFGTTALAAKTEADIDVAARAFASAVVTAGITAVMALLLRQSARQLQATRGANIGDVIRPRNPGLRPVSPDSQAGSFWRRPTVTGDPTMPPGRGGTSAWGDVRFSTAGSVAEQQLARLHELVHQLLTPRLRPLRTFRVQLRMSAYTRSALMRYLEEAMAETFAQLRVNGLSSLMTGLTFPVANGYMTLQQLACEGAEIGTILLGTERSSIQFVPGSPPSAEE